MKFVILGCGSSVGVPWITGNWGNCDKKNIRNQRTRCSAYLQKGNLSNLCKQRNIKKFNKQIRLLFLWRERIYTNT